MTFDGELLQRGFWIYVWRISGQGRTVAYVGRTGDSSSPHAASPFGRIGQHLDARPNAKGNSLARNLNAAGVQPHQSHFEMLAIGPIFEEQEDMDAHKPLRDQLATLEHLVASEARAAGIEVLGVHHPKGQVDSELRAFVIDQALRFLR